MLVSALRRSLKKGRDTGKGTVYRCPAFTASLAQPHRYARERRIILLSYAKMMDLMVNTADFELCTATTTSYGEVWAWNSLSISLLLGKSVAEEDQFKYLGGEAAASWAY